MVSKHRHNLKEASVRASMKVGSWHDNGLLPMSALTEMFNNLHKRVNTKGKSTQQGKEKGKGKEVIELDDSDDSSSE